MWQIEYYEKANGRIPVQEFLDSLSNKSDLPYIMNRFGQLGQLGNQLKRPHADYLRDHIYELRVSTINGEFRFLYFYHNNKIIVLTHGFQKKTDKVPDGQIKLAIEYRKEYLKRLEKRK